MERKYIREHNRMMNDIRRMNNYMLVDKAKFRNWVDRLNKEMYHSPAYIFKETMKVIKEMEKELE